ncbi:MAG: polysaccharide pyruvyl transferase family protein [Oricola sp.]
MKIVLFGLFGCGNLGNDGSLEAVVKQLRGAAPDARLTVVCLDRDVVAERIDADLVALEPSQQLAPAVRKLDKLLLRLPSRLLDFVSAFRVLRTAEAMIVPGTGILDDYGERPYQMPLVIFLWTLAARLARTKVAYLSIGAGPIRNRFSRFLLLSAARMAHYRSYRDTVSRDFMTRCGIDTSGDEVFPDVAFGLPVPAAPVRDRRAGDGLVVGLGAMNYLGWYRHSPQGAAIYRRYVANITEFAAWLLDSGCSIRLLTGELNDRDAVEDVLRGLRERRAEQVRDRVVAEPARSLDDVMEQLAQTDVAVVSRFHNIVCAIKVAVPVMSLGYAAKNEALLDEVGLGGMSQHMEDFDLARLKDDLRSLAARRAEHRAALRARAAQFAERLREQDALVMRRIGFPDGSAERGAGPRKQNPLPSRRGGSSLSG